MNNNNSVVEKFALVPHSQYSDLMRLSSRTGAGDLKPPQTTESPNNGQINTQVETLTPPPGLPADAIEQPQSDITPRWIDVWQSI